MKKFLSTTLGLLLLVCTVQAQRTIHGTVTSESNEPLIGAAILLKGTTIGTTTDFDGTYELEIPEGTGQVIQFSYTGYDTQEVPLDVSNVIDVKMAEGSILLGEVVVTALGFETHRNKVGVASSTVEGAALTNSGEVGLINSLAGKSPGLQIISSSGEPGAGATIRIRGATSITGDVQPLIVVDGVPIFNDSYYGQGFGGQATTSGGSLGSGGGVTQQSRLNDLNPADIASVEVLRGASAAAVWGSRAANGVLVITTKKGKYQGTKNWTVNLNTSLALDEINKEIPLQHEFGAGRGQIYSFTPPGGQSWGDKIADRTGGADDYLTEQDPGYQGRFISDQTRNTYYAIASGNQNDLHGGKNSRDIFDVYDYLFHTGATWSTSVAMSHADGNGNVYISLGRLEQDGIIANGSNYERTTARVNTGRQIGKFYLNGDIGYTLTTANRAQMGSNLNGLFLGGLRQSIDFDSRDYEGTYIDPDGVAFQGRQRAYRNPLGGSTNATYNNPLWTINRVPSDNTVNRFTGKGELRYEPLQWLNVTARLGMDTYTDERADFYPFFAAGDNNGGRFTKETITSRQLNFDLIGRARINLTSNIALNALIGTGVNQINFDDQGATTRNFVNPFSPPQLPNGNVVPFNQQSETRTTGIYGSFGFELYNQLYLNLSARQDYLSTLPEDNNGVFYPAADVSWQFDHLVAENSLLSSGRLRGGWGQVGRGPQPYLTRQTFFQPTSASIGWGEGWGPGVDVSAYGGAFALNTVAANPDIKPETKTEYEAGIDLGILKDRLTAGFTYYHNQTKDLIIQVLTPQSSGFVSQITNAAEIENQGYEIDLQLVPVAKDQLRWTLYGNFSHNHNNVVSLAGTNTILLSGFQGTSSNAVLGEQLGVIYGNKWERDTNGQLVLDENGFPVQSDVNGVLGDPNPDFRMGAGTGLQWRDFSLHALFEISQGGSYWNGTKGALAFFGRPAYTAVETTLSAAEAASLHIWTGQTVADAYGYLKNQDGTYTVRGEIKNFGDGDVFVEENWYRNGPGSGFTGPAEQFMEDASWVRLRELSLAYHFNNKLTDSLKWLRGATVTLTGRNLFLWTDYTGNDPDTNLTGAGLNGLGLDYFQNPSSRTYKVELNLSF